MKKNNYEKNVISNKKGCIIFFSLMAMIAIKLLYDWLLKTLTLEEYSPFFFANVKLPFSYFFIIYPFLFAFIFIICIFELPKRKVSDKKYIVYSSIFLCLILVVTVFLVVMFGVLIKIQFHIIQYFKKIKLFTAIMILKMPNFI